MLWPYLPLDSNGMDALVDHGLRLHNLWRHFWWVTLRVWVDLEVKAPWVGAVPVVVVGIHCSHAELVCAAWTDHMLASLTKSFATMVFQNKQKRELISAQLFFLPCAVVGHFLHTCATVSLCFTPSQPVRLYQGEHVPPEQTTCYGHWLNHFKPRHSKINTKKRQLISAWFFSLPCGAFCCCSFKHSSMCHINRPHVTITD